MDGGCFRYCKGVDLKAVQKMLGEAVTTIQRALVDGDSSWAEFADLAEGRETSHALRAAPGEQAAADSHWIRRLKKLPTVAVGEVDGHPVLLCPEYNDDGRVISLERRVDDFLSKLLGRASNSGLDFAASAVLHPSVELHSPQLHASDECDTVSTIGSDPRAHTISG